MQLSVSELQIRRVTGIIQRHFFLFLNESIYYDPSLEPSWHFFLFLNENMHYDPSLEPSWEDGSNEGS